MKHINKLFKFDRQLLGNGYSKALEYINSVIPLEVIKVKSGTKFGTWTTPKEWKVKEAWVKYNDKKIIDYTDNPLHLMVYSAPFKGKVSKKEFLEHLYTSEECPDALSYEYSFYEPKWGFSINKEVKLEGFWTKLLEACPECNLGKKVGAKVKVDQSNEYTRIAEALPEGEYEICVDTEFVDSEMEIGVHTIKGGEREILLFAHLDHPYQANDNLSGVSCLINLAEKIKSNHTVKIIFCPETIGSIAYYYTQDTSKVDFVISVDAIGNDNTLLIQKSYDKEARINYAIHSAVQELGVSYRKGDFRILIGSDEYIFNDPMIGIPGILLTRFPYKEYHTSQDTPKVVIEDRVKEVENVILKTIEIYEKDYIPKRKEKGILMRSSLGLQTPHKLLNRDLDYLWYDADGKKYISEIILPLGVNYEYAYKFYNKLKENKLIDE